MKVISLVFLALFLFAHTAGDEDELRARPLSMFRDGELAVVGYTLFALLLAVGGLLIEAAVRARRGGEAAVFGLALLLLIVVAATPSLDGFHFLCSIALLALFYSFYAVLLYRSHNPWFLPHLATPVMLLLATQFHSFGLWQKSLIVYFVLAANIHYAVLQHAAALGARARRRGGPLRRRIVFALEPGPEWSRRA
jgi:hypothetical protein